MLALMNILILTTRLDSCIMVNNLKTLHLHNTLCFHLGLFLL